MQKTKCRVQQRTLKAVMGLFNAMRASLCSATIPYSILPDKSSSIPASSEKTHLSHPSTQQQRMLATSATVTSPQNENGNATNDSVETATWVENLPEAFGIRASVKQSKYRWCVRESAMWGIATGTAMSLHRLRMRSATVTAINAGFLSFFTIYLGSYYFCVKRRDHREKMIELMMKLNSFAPADDMPEPVPIDENHPFVTPGSDDSDGDTDSIPAERQYVAHLPERKEWQEQLPTQDAANVFTSGEPKKK